MNFVNPCVTFKLQGHPQLQAKDIGADLLEDGYGNRGSSSAEDAVHLEMQVREQATEIQRLKALLEERVEKKVSDPPQEKMPGTEKGSQELEMFGERWKKCHLCAHQYRNIRDLLKHYKAKHSGEKYEEPEKKYEFGCDLCGSVYKEEQVLKRHIKTVHNPEECRFCGKKQTHIRRHEAKCEGKTKGKRKRKICDYCGNGFANLPIHFKSCSNRKLQLKGEQLPSCDSSQQTAPEPQGSGAEDNYQRIQQEEFTENELQEEIVRQGNVASTFDQMANTAVQMASVLGMSLVQGVRSAMTGQCLLESVADQLFHRKPQEDEQLVFGKLIEEIGEEQCSHQNLRLNVVNLLMDSEAAFNRFAYEAPGGALLSEEEAQRHRREEWTRQLEALKERGQYALSAGDLMVDGICAFLGLSIVILRTSSPAKHPFDVHTPECLGGHTREEYPPLLLMFSEEHSHYEEARPQDVASEITLMLLFELYTTEERLAFLNIIDWRYEDNPMEGSEEDGGLGVQLQSTENNPCQETPGRSKKMRKLYQTPEGQLGF